MDELKYARTLYEAKGDKSSMRRYLRRDTGLQRNVGPMLEAIPTENGVGLAKAGLQVLLNVRKPLFGFTLGKAKFIFLRPSKIVPTHAARSSTFSSPSPIESATRNSCKGFTQTPDASSS
jgi:hypothetical protein